jgi:inhibitor of cysteine peptidase
MKRLIVAFALILSIFAFSVAQAESVGMQRAVKPICPEATWNFGAQIVQAAKEEGAANLSDPSKSLVVKVGREFTIVLESNRTTGYQWQTDEPVDESIVKLIRAEYQAPETRLVGAGGKEIWVFRALSQGRTTIRMKYVRPWEKDASPAKKASFVIVVEK